MDRLLSKVRHMLYETVGMLYSASTGLFRMDHSVWHKLTPFSGRSITELKMIFLSPLIACIITMVENWLDILPRILFGQSKLSLETFASETTHCSLRCLRIRRHCVAGQAEITLTSVNILCIEASWNILSHHGSFLPVLLLVAAVIHSCSDLTVAAEDHSHEFNMVIRYDKVGTANSSQTCLMGTSDSNCILEEKPAMNAPCGNGTEGNWSGIRADR